MHQLGGKDSTTWVCFTYKSQRFHTNLVNDKVTEYPKTINVLKRFNLYPELAVGTLKRIFDQTAKKLDIKTKECWQINRGENYSPIMSCEGLGDDHYFYITPVWWLSGLLMSGIFLYGSHVSQSLWGGISE